MGNLLSTRYGNGRSAWIYLLAAVGTGCARYAVRYYDAHDDDTFTVHYHERFTVDRDCDAFLSPSGGYRD